MELDLEPDVFSSLEFKKLSNEFVEEVDSDSENDGGGDAELAVDEDPTRFEEGDLQIDESAEDLNICLSQNIEYQEILKEVIYKLEMALENNKDRQLDLQQELNEGYAPKKSSEKDDRIPSFFKKPHPYFQDKDRVACPPNEDRILKDRLSIVDEKLCYPPHYWLNSEKKILCEGVESSARRSLMERVVDRKEYFSGKLITSKGKELEEIRKKLAELNEQLDEIKDMSFKNLLSRDAKIDWMKISTIDLKGSRTEEACEYKWTNDLHPSINHGQWTKDEEDSLKEIVKKFSGDTWETIAKELNTRRNALQCCQRYHRFINPVSQRGAWSEDEKRLFIEVVDMCRYGTHIPWLQVHYYMEGRDLNSIRKFWSSSGNPEIRRGAWAKEEDFLLLCAIRKHGTNWMKIERHFSGSRTKVQLRERYFRTLDKSLNFRKFTGEEDRKLVRLVDKLGHKWCAIAKEMPGRTDVMLSSRYRKITSARPNVMRVLATETDSSRPLTATYNNMECVKYRDRLHKFVDSRWKSFLSQNLRTRISMRNFGQTVATAEEPNRTKSSAADDILLTEAKNVYKHESEMATKKPFNPYVVTAKKAVDDDLHTMLRPLLHSQPLGFTKQKFTSLAGKKLDLFMLTEKVFYDALNVACEEVTESKYGAGAPAAIESFFGPMTHNISVLPPARSTLQGFRILLADLNRLADSATNLENYNTISSLTSKRDKPFSCSDCGTNSSISGRNIRTHEIGETSGTDDASSPADVQGCSKCVGLNEERDKYAMLRLRFMAMFFWPALMSLVKPPDKSYLDSNEETVLPGNFPATKKISRRRSKRPAEASSRSSSATATKVAKQTNTHNEPTSVPPRQSSRLAGKQKK